MRKSTSIIAVTLFFIGMLGVSINFGGDSNQESIFLADVAASTPSIGGNSIKTLDYQPRTWFSCAGPVADEKWTYNQGFSTISCAGNTYLGHYGQGAQVNSLALAAGAHQGIVVSFKLALIDSWDEEFFQVKADGVIVYSLTHHFISYIGLGTNTCVRQDENWNDFYKNITFGFNHTASTVTFSLTSTLDQEKNDESWGVCDFTVQLTRSQVDASGRLIKPIDDKPTTFFACGNLFAEDLWQYSQGFSTIKCFGNGNTYLAYGKGGVVSSPEFAVSAHQGIIVTFKLAFIDSWDRETFNVTADGVSVYSVSHSGTNSISNTCQSKWNDAYSDVTFGFNHTAKAVYFTFSSTLDQAASDEAWGICDFTVTAAADPVTKGGSSIFNTTVPTTKNTTTSSSGSTTAPSTSNSTAPSTGNTSAPTKTASLA